MRKVTMVAQVCAIGVSVALPVAAQVQEPTPQPVILSQTPPPPDSQQPPTPRKGSPISATYDGGTVLRSEDGKFELKLTGRMQFRYDMRRVEVDGDGGEESEIIQRFLLPRTRVTMEGHAFTRAVTYKLEGSFGDDGTPRLRDFYTNVAMMEGKLQFRFGQFKRPFNRQEIVSDFATELPEKALTNTFVEGARDVGVALHNGYDKSPDGLEWVVAFMNGAVAAGDFEPELIARLGVNIGGIKGYSEGDLEGGPLRLGAAINYRLKNLDNGPMTHLAGADIVIKLMGLSLQAAGFVQKVEDVDDATFAGHVQAGYFVIPRAAQVDARFAVVPLPLVVGGDQEYRMEIRGGFNYYWFGHNLKLSSDVGVVDDSTDGASAELQLRIQGQLIF